MSPRRTNRALPLREYGTCVYYIQTFIFVYCVNRLPRNVYIPKMGLVLVAEDNDASSLTNAFIVHVVHTSY
jgi:hypothetical protein